jgi:hypothetical protein
MREKKNYILITFDTTTQAIAMEKYCMAEGIPGRLIPIPSAVSAGCGICWRMLPEEYERCSDRFDPNAYAEKVKVTLF